MSEEGQFRIRRPREGEVLGIVEAMLGASRIRVRCQDGKMRTGRIPGRFRKRVWVREGDVVLIKPWDIKPEEKGDMVYRYTKTQANWLKKKGILKMER